jgi:hypothetical protein
MEIKSAAIFEILKDERVYRLEVPAGAPLGEVYQVSGEFLDKFIEMINENAKLRKEQQEKIKEEKPDVEPEQTV